MPRYIKHRVRTWVLRKLIKSATGFDQPAKIAIADGGLRITDGYLLNTVDRPWGDETPVTITNVHVLILGDQHPFLTLGGDPR